MKLVYLFTSFPVLTESFYQREIRALLAMKSKLSMTLYSLWGGEDRFCEQPVTRFPKWKLVLLLWWLPYWACARPRTLAALARELAGRPMPDWENAGQTLIGVSFALIHARSIAATKPDLLHAAWANMPCTAAQLISALTGVPYSFGAHAYDIFRSGGDWLLASKLEGARAVVSSSAAARDSLVERGAQPSKLHIVRRGLDVFPPCRAPRAERLVLRILSVGRLVEKKGYFDQLEIYAACARAGFAFEARIAGDGPLHRALGARIAALGLDDRVRLLGRLGHDEVAGEFDWADVFLYSGRPAQDGNRDGLPNVVCEAMASGVPVVSTPVSGVPEAIEDGRSGLLYPTGDSECAVGALCALARDDALVARLRAAARAWVEQHFDAHRNAAALVDCWRGAAGTAAGSAAGTSSLTDAGNGAAAPGHAQPRG